MTAAWLSAATEEHIDIGAPPLVWGGGVLVFLLLLLWMTLAFGKGRG